MIFVILKNKMYNASTKEAEQYCSASFFNVNNNMVELLNQNEPNKVP